MARRQPPTRKLTRRDKAREERIALLAARHEKQARESYESPKPSPVRALEPKTANQKTALSLLQTKPVVFLTGSAGTGKSMLAAHRASTLYASGIITKIYLVRPAVSVGKSIGLLPGDIKEKLAPYFAQTMQHLSTFLGAKVLSNAIEKGNIEMKPVEYLRGMSFEKCVVIAEEVQNFTAEEMEMMLTRIGHGCTIIFTGDTKQHDLKGESGLDKTIQLLERTLQTHPSYMTSEDMDQLDDGIGVVRFTPADVVRSGLTRAFVKLYYHS